MPGRSISVIDPLSPAIQRAKLMLFSPFDLGKWFVIGFCAWLAQLGQGGFNFNVGFPPRGSQGHLGSRGDIQQFLHNEMPVIILVGLIALVVGIAITLVVLWLSSRGRFMFLHCVALNRAEVKAPWHTYRRQGNSLFCFRLVVGLVFFFAALLLGGIIALSVGLFCAAGFHLNAAAIAAIILGGLILLCGVIACLLILKFTQDFVVPIMYLHGCRCVDGWREFAALLKSNKGTFALYILFQVVIGMAVEALVFVLVLSSCCCCGLGIVFLIPYIGTVALLPIFVFVRSYSLYYFCQFGLRYDVFEPQVELTG